MFHYISFWSAVLYYLSVAFIDINGAREDELFFFPSLNVSIAIERLLGWRVPLARYDMCRLVLSY